MNTTDHSLTPKRLIKRGLQHIAARFGRHRRSGRRPELLVLMYHRILPDDDRRAELEEPGMMVTPGTFRMHLEILGELFEFVRLQDWIDARNSGSELPARACALTFDDGWRDNYEFAFPALREQGIPATIFLVSDLVGTDQSFWPERLAGILREIACRQPGSWSHPSLEWLKSSELGYRFTSAAPTGEELSEIIGFCKQYDDTEIMQRLDEICAALDIGRDTAPVSMLDWEQVNEMAASGLIDFGSHTRHHIRLDRETADAVLDSEIIESRRIIEQHLSAEVVSFCFPNGDFNDAALARVRATYRCAVSTRSGWNTAADDVHLLNRIGVHEDISADRTSFLSRLSGWL